jgi:hypothetical protein
MKKKKILLVLLPFWDPQIPPLGISCLKRFLQQQGYPIKTVDANVDVKLKETYHHYFDTLKEYVPETRLGNFYKIGHDVLRNHMTAHLNHKDEDEIGYIELIKVLINSIFFIEFDRLQVLKLDDILRGFYGRLETYCIHLLEKETPDLLGISVYSDTLPASLFAFKLAKKRYPHIQTVMGGGIFANDLAVGTPNLAFFLEKTPYIDKILVGEGEILFLKLLQGQLPESQKLFTLNDINNEMLDISSPFASLNIPDFSDFDLSFYPNLTTYTSRSCPFLCKFCSETLQWGKYRKKSSKQVVEELVKLYQTYGNQLFFMSDSLLNPTITGLARELVKEELSLYWDGYLRVDDRAADAKNTMLWRRAGFYRARLGVESGSNRVLERMNKKVTSLQIKAAISNLAYAGIKTTTYWVVGYPGETEVDFQETLLLIEEIADDIYEADCSPFWYYLKGQVGSDGWSHQSRLLYPPEAREMLMLQTWILDVEPSREKIYERMWRFVDHCKKLGIPNPYSLQDIHKADLRWKELHKQAVPPLVRFDDKSHYVDENKKIKELMEAQSVEQEQGDFGF